MKTVGEKKKPEKQKQTKRKRGRGKIDRRLKISEHKQAVFLLGKKAKQNRPGAASSFQQTVMEVRRAVHWKKKKFKIRIKKHIGPRRRKRPTGEEAEADR